ncbi:hypothetical protein NBRC116597_22320 [Phaeobacter sp. NW0010-22]
MATLSAINTISANVPRRTHRLLERTRDRLRTTGVAPFALVFAKELSWVSFNFSTATYDARTNI